MALNYDSEAALNLVKNIHELNCLYDVFLVAGLDGKKFPVHKLILSAASRYFNALLGPNFKEAHQSEVVLKDIDGSTLKIIIDYCYCCKIDINDENVDDIIAASSRMEFVQLTQQCESFWVSNLNIQNCLRALMLSDTYNLNSLWKDALYVACENFDILPEDDLMQIDNRSLNSILKEDMVNTLEDVLAFRFVQWTRFDEDNRKKFVTSLVKSIRLEHISEKILKNGLDLFYKEHGCFGFIIAEYRRRSRNSMPITLKRMIDTDKLYVVDTCNSDISIGRIIIHELNDEFLTFTKRLEIIFQRNVKNVLFLNGKLYVFFSDTKEWHSVDLLTKTQENLPELPFRSHNSPVIVGHYIYVFKEFHPFANSGKIFREFFDQHYSISLIYFFDTKRKLWEHRKSLPFELHNISAVELGGLIYVAGELTANKFTSSNFWCYDPNNDNWTEKQRINTIIPGGKHLIKVKQFVCLINFNIDNMMIYDAETNKWNTEWNVNVKANEIEQRQRIYQTATFKGKTYGIISFCSKFGLINLVATAKTCKVKFITNVNFNWIDVGLFVYKSMRNVNQ